MRFCRRGGGSGVGSWVGRGFRFADCRESFYVKFFVIGIAGGAVHFDSFHQQDADVNVGLFVRGQPHFVIDVGLFEDDAGALLEVGEEAAGNFHVADEEGVEAHDIEGFFVDPDDAAEFLDRKSVV